METLTISYSQLFVVNKGIDIPAIDWTEQDLQRGYAMFKGGVVFETLSDYECEISINLGEFRINKDALRVVTVPFEVGENGIDIMSVISEYIQFDISRGLFNLTLQAIPLQEITSDGLFIIRYELYFTKA